MFIPLNDLSDPRVRDFTQLKDVNLRKSFEAERGLYLAESFSVIARALAAGHQPRSILTNRHWLERLQETLGPRAADIPIFVAKEEQLTHLTGFSMHRGAIAAMERPPLPELGEVLAERMAAPTLVWSTRSSKISTARAVRVSMGTVFSLPWTRIDTWPDTSALKTRGFIVAGLALTDQAVSLPDFCASLQSQGERGQQPKVALVLGTEGSGMTKQALAGCDQLVKIPLSHGVDSLNVAAAGAVACYAVSQALGTNIQTP